MAKTGRLALHILLVILSLTSKTVAPSMAICCARVYQQQRQLATAGKVMSFRSATYSLRSRGMAILPAVALTPSKGNYRFHARRRPLKVRPPRPAPFGFTGSLSGMLHNYALSLVEELLLRNLPTNEARHLGRVGLLCSTMQKALLR